MLAQQDLDFLRDLTGATIEASRVAPGVAIGSSARNSQRFDVIRPGGRDCYPAYWIRDFAMALPSGFISEEEIQNHLQFTLRAQNGRERRQLKSGAIIPPDSIPDHINFDGSAVFYPGTMSAGDDQGGEPFGILPPADNHYYAITIASHCRGHQPSEAQLQQLINGFHTPTCNASTGGMFHTTKDQRAVGFGFCDTVHLTGSILFASLLRYVAARQLAAMCAVLNRGGERGEFAKIAESIRSHIVPIFHDPEAKHGWLLAATETGRQPDVWGTLYALHLDILPKEFAAAARNTVADAVRRGTITSQGAVRHIPTDFDFSPTTAWEKTAPGFPKGTYQNGGYWHTPAGWLIESLHESHPGLARQIFNEYIAHLREHDFRKGPEHGAPYECFTKDGEQTQNPAYMASVAVPYAVLRDLAGRGSS